MKRLGVIIAVILLGGGVFCIEGAAAEKGAEGAEKKEKRRVKKKASRVDVERIDAIPDILQTEPNGGLLGGGIWYCGPAAISNSLMWLADNGYEDLRPDINSREKAQFEIARILGSEGYMNTIEGVGTDAEGVLRGVSRYIEDRGYRKFRLSYQGWGRHPRRFGTGIKIPRLTWIKKGMIGDSAVWLNAGWYVYDKSTRQYRRIGEHWLTLVGYGVDREGNPDPYVLIVHDPAPRAGLEPGHSYVRLEPIRRRGQLVGAAEGLGRNARGYYLLEGDMKINKRANVAILDGAVVLKMKKIVNKGESVQRRLPRPPAAGSQ